MGGDGRVEGWKGRRVAGRMIRKVRQKKGLRMWRELTIQIGKESEARKQLAD